MFVYKRDFFLFFKGFVNELELPVVLLHYKGLYRYHLGMVKTLYDSRYGNMVRIRGFVCGGTEESAFLTLPLLSNNIKIQ